MSRDEMLREKYEDALFALLMNQIAEVEGKALWEENERLVNDPDAQIPEDLDRRCQATIRRTFAKRDGRSAAHFSYKVFRRFAVAATVAMLLFGTVYATFPEVRVKTLNLLIESSNVATRLEFDLSADKPMSTDGGASSQYSLLGYYLPPLPKDFVIEYQDSDSRSAWITFINDFGATISFNVSQGELMVHSVDTEDADSVENIVIQGFDGLLICKGERVHVTWGNTDVGCFIYIIGEGVDKETVMTLAENMVLYKEN